MPMGPGKYDKECEDMREKTNAEAVLLIVFGGDRGSGFSMTATALAMMTLDVPKYLRSTADQIEQSFGKG